MLRPDSNSLHYSYSASQDDEKYILPSSARHNSLLNVGSCDVEHIKETGNTPTIGAIFIVMNAALGAAMLNMPHAFSVGGIPLSILAESIFVIFAFGGLVILGYCAEFDNASIYQEVMRSMGGRALENIVELIILAYTFTSAISFMVLAADQGLEIFKLIFGFGTEGDRKLVVGVLSTVIILPLCIPKDVSFLQYPSILCTVSIAYVTFLVIIESFILPSSPIESKPASLQSVLNVFPALAFGFQCHVSSIPVYSGLRHRNLKNWSVITFCAVAACYFIYASVGICGYVTFGKLVLPDILDSYGTDNYAAIVGRFLMVISLTTSYPILHFCGRASLESICRKLLRMTDEEGRRTWNKRYYYQTFIWFILAVLGAMFVPSIQTLVNPIGAFAAVFIIGFPGFALIKASERQTNNRSKIEYISLNLVGCVFIIVSAFLFGESFISGIYGIFA